MRDSFFSLKPLHTLNISDLEIGTMTSRCLKIMRRRPSANPAQPHCADGCHGRGLLLHQRQESASTSGKLGCFVRSTSPKVWQILWISEPGKLHAGILKATCRLYFLKGWYHEVHFAAVLDIFGRFIFQPFSDISCKCMRITQPLSILFNIRSCWIHVKVDWQFRFWWLFGISFPNCATCLGWQRLHTSSHSLVNMAGVWLACNPKWSC